MADKNNGFRIEVPGQTKFNFDNKNKNVIDFLNEHYNILIPVQDPEKIQIIYKDKDGRYKHSPSFEDVSMHIEESGIQISDAKLWKIISSPNCIEPFDPVKEYFNSIRGTYKGESHIDILCKHITPRCFDDNTPEYYRKRTDYLIRKWLVACVACWIGNIPNPISLGLISAKGGIGKTYFTKFLIPDPLNEYYISPSKDDKLFNMEEGYVRYMLVNYEELVGITKSTINVFKKVQTDERILTKFRHERIATYKNRMACSTFSSNYNRENGGFIHPWFGDTRRFGCIEIEPYGIDQKYSEIVDINQVWSEALNLYESTEFDFIFNMADFDDITRYNMRYTFESTAMYYVQSCLSIPDSDDDGEKLNATSIIKRLQETKLIKNEDLGPKDTKLNIRTIGYALETLGFQRATFRGEKDMPLHGWHIKFNK